MAYQVENPILVLVGATASAGNSMFADELFNVEMASSIKGLSPLISEGKFDGLTAVTMCRVIHDRVTLWADH